MNFPKQAAAPAHERMAYPINDAAHQLGIGRSSLYELVKSGEVKAIKIAGRTLIPRSELERVTSVAA